MTETDDEITKSMILTSTKINIEKRGEALPIESKQLVKRLIAQAHELQKRFSLAERTALILKPTLTPESGLNDAVNNTYEGHAFETIRMQLFRILIVDLYAAVFDESKDSQSNTEAGSIRSILKELRRDTKAIDALREYYADTNCLDIEVTKATGKKPDDDEVNHRKTCAKAQHREEAISSFNTLWTSIQRDSVILNTDYAKRIKWARSKLVAHFEKTDYGLMALDAKPNAGDGTLKWGEPIALLENVREYVYAVFLLITGTHWIKDTSIDTFYAETFWDRFKNGSTDLLPPAL